MSLYEIVPIGGSPSITVTVPASTSTPSPTAPAKATLTLSSSSALNATSMTSGPITATNPAFNVSIPVATASSSSPFSSAPANATETYVLTVPESVNAPTAATDALGLPVPTANATVSPSEELAITGRQCDQNGGIDERYRTLRLDTIGTRQYHYHARGDTLADAHRKRNCSTFSGRDDLCDVLRS
jgi:hypothetical protein